MKLDDNGLAVMAYPDGDLTSPRVARYFFDLGLGDILPMSADASALQGENGAVDGARHAD
jgi:hypothetical protein